MANNLEERFEAIEECYQFMLAYAAQGVPTDEGGQVREHLQRASKALVGLAEACANGMSGDRESLRRFLAVLDRDACDSLAALDVVRSQPVISSSLIDNPNASAHLRALLTDIFLLGEVFRMQRAQTFMASARGQ